MSLRAEDFRPLPPRISAVARSVRLLNAHAPVEDDDMPRGVYERKKRGPKKRFEPNEVLADDPPPAGSHAIVKRGRKPGTKVQRKAAIVAATDGGPRFGVFDDGSVEVRLPSCSGTMAPEDAAALVAFIGRLK